MANKRTCANCRNNLDVGKDAFRVTEGVIGVKDFVPLEKPLFFCNESCLSEYFDTSNLPSLPNRIP